MNATVTVPQTSRPAPSDAQMIAFDAVAEFAGILCIQSTALLAASSSCDLAETEARLWACKRTLAAACASWREAVPSLPKREAA